MTTSLDTQIWEQLARVEAGQLSIRDFDEWFSLNTWQAESIVSKDVLQAIYQIRQRLTWFDMDVWTSDELHDFFRTLLTNHPTSTRLSRAV